MQCVEFEKIREFRGVLRYNKKMNKTKIFILQTRRSTTTRAAPPWARCRRKTAGTSPERRPSLKRKATRRTPRALNKSDTKKRRAQTETCALRLFLLYIFTLRAPSWPMR